MQSATVKIKTTMGTLYHQKFVLLFVAAMTLCAASFAQVKTVRYTIISKNDSVGNMQATQKMSGDDIVYTLSSVVETKMLMNIKVSVQEEALYHKEKLTSSSSLRIVNDKAKGNKQTKASSEGYVMIDDGKESRLNEKAISFNISKMYFKEPAGISRIYSDYYQKLLSIATISSHVYRIDMPEGGTNIYYYENGACKKVEIKGALFSAQMILQK